MECWNGGRESSWSYRQEIIGSDGSSSRSGTIVSSSASSRGSTFSKGAAIHFDTLRIHEEEEHNGNNFDDHDGESRPWGWWEKAADECRVRVRSLVQEFFVEQSSANCSFETKLLKQLGMGSKSVVVTWLTELGVEWVLRLHGQKEVLLDDHDLQGWIRALHEIVQTMCFMRPIFPDIGSIGLPSSGEEEEHVDKTCVYRYHFVLFIQEAMLKILTFVDFTVALDPYNYISTMGIDPVMAPLYSKLIALLGVHDALSEASDEIVSQFDPPTSVEVQMIEIEMKTLLLANKSKVVEAIWSSMENIKTKLILVGDDSSSSLDPQVSSDIHKATWFVVRYIMFLQSNYRSLDAIIRAKYMQYLVHVRPLHSMVLELVSCLEEKLANISKSFPDQGFRFLFLLNNSYTIESHISKYFGLRTDKIEGHIERYVEVSWTLLLSCLLNPTPLCLGKNYSPLSKFESDFHKIYTTQKQWKVPDPELRRRLSKAISNKIIPAYTEYLEDKKVTTPKFTPQELDEMLQEMFEG